MSGLRRAHLRLRAFFHKPELDVALEEELAAHLEMAIEENLGRGLPAEEARRQALVRFGGVQQARERQREARGLMTLDILLQDLKFTVRTLGRDRGFTAVSILILALGIGANIAVFSVVNTILLRPLPFYRAQELVWIAPPPAKCGFSCATYSSDAFDEFRAQTRSYQDVTGYFAFSTADNLRLTGHGETVPATGIDVINNFFQVLGVRAEMGRVFTPDDARNGAPPVVLLTNAWWRRQFAGDRAIVGKTIDMNGQQTTVIGVLPASFDFGAVFAPGSKVDAFTPLNLDAARDWGNIVTFMGRLKPGVPLGQARAEADMVSRNLYFSVKYPDTLGNYKGSIIPVPLKDYVSGRLRRSLVVLWTAVGMILLIACVNLSNLMLARGAARGKEFAMRSALGASRGRIVCQLLTESLVLSGAGAVLGLGLAAILLAWLSHQGAVALPLLSALHIDGFALAWTVVVALFAALLFGLFPGLRIASGNLQESLKDSGAGSGQSRKHEGIRAVLVVSEVALACVLLVSAGLLLHSFMRVLDVDLGFEPKRAASVKVEYDDGGGKDAPIRRTATFQQILSRVSALPGVDAAGIVDYLPLEQNRAWGWLIPKGRTYRQGELPDCLVYMTTPGYVRAMGMRLHGRDFTWDDSPTGEKVIIINQTVARFLWPGEDAVGKIASMNGVDRRVVGVIDDVHTSEVEGDPGWQVYFPQSQESPAGAHLVIHTRMAPAALAGTVLRTLRELNPKQPVAEFRPIRNVVDHAVSPRRFFVMLVGFFAGLGLLLAALGIYGVISYSVTQRTQEIGVKMALGATTGRIQKDVIARTLSLAGTGVLLGSIASLGAARLVASLLFATSPRDLTTYIGVFLALLVVAAISGYIPARRASRISPLVALRVN